MSLVRFLPAWLHAIADYAVAASLIAVSLIVGGPGLAVATGVVIGAVVLVVSLLTRYPLGVIKVLPFPVHSAGDYLAAVLLVGAPFALGFTHSARGLTFFYFGAGVAVLLVSLVTNYQYRPVGQAGKGDTGWSPAENRAPAATSRTQAPSYPPQGAAETAPVNQPAYASQQAVPSTPSYGAAPSESAAPGGFGLAVGLVADPGAGRRTGHDTPGRHSPNPPRSGGPPRRHPGGPSGGDQLRRTRGRIPPAAGDPGRAPGQRPLRRLTGINRRRHRELRLSGAVSDCRQ